MHIFDLNALFKKHGCVMVLEYGRCYHAIKSEDIIDGKVKDNAYPVVSVSCSTLPEIAKQDMEDFVERCKQYPAPLERRVVFDNTRLYVVSPLESEEKRRNDLAALWVPMSIDALKTILDKKGNDDER